MFKNATVFNAADVEVPDPVREEVKRFWTLMDLGNEAYTEFNATVELDEWPIISKFLLDNGIDRLLITYSW